MKMKRFVENDKFLIAVFIFEENIKLGKVNYLQTLVDTAYFFPEPVLTTVLALFNTMYCQNVYFFLKYTGVLSKLLKFCTICKSVNCLFEPERM